MSYIVEYTSLSGKRIPMIHKVFESADAANAHAAENIANGSYKSYTVNQLTEGHKIMPPMDPKYVERKGLEGPFTTLSGKVVYYDPKEGSYYDPDTDMYMSYDEFQKYDNDYSDMKDERDIDIKEVLRLALEANSSYDEKSVEREIEKSGIKKGSKKAKMIHSLLKGHQGSRKDEVNEGISDDAHHMERDHEVQMARSDLYKTANYAIKLHAILKGISEEQGLDGWMQSKITKAADYMSSVFHALEYDELERSQSEPMPAMESEDKEKIQKQIDQTEKHMKSFSGNTSSVKMKKVAMQKKIAGLKAKLKELSEGKTASQNRNALVNKIKKSGVVKSGSMSKDDKKVSETTTAGGIATAPMPMGKVIKRKKK